PRSPPRWRSQMPSRTRRRAPASVRTTGSRATPPRLSGSQFERPAGSSSLLFSCTGVDSLLYLAFHWLAERVFAQFVERNSVHVNLVDATVVKLIALAQEVRARLRIRDDGDHPRGRADDAIEPERADLQASLARRKIFAGALVFLPVDERLE